MATTAVPSGTRNTSQPLSAAFSMGAVFVTIGSLAFISVNNLPPREAYDHPISIAGGVVATIGILLLSLGLMRWRTTLPGWAVVTSAAGIWFAGPLAWSQSTVIVAAANNTDNQLFDDLFFESPWVFGGMAPKTVLCLIGFLGLAVAGWRQRTIPRPAAALGTAGIASVWPPYPPSLILASLAFFLIARTGVTSRE
jgi:hypothetical protein